MFGIGYWVLIGMITIVSVGVSWMLKKRFKEYAQIPIRSGLSGKEVAERMLKEHGIHDVRVVSVQGTLTDHYNPMDKTVNLSPEVYGGRSVSAAAVAAHECGHAVQHATAYSFLKFRSAMVPMQAASGKILNIVVIGGLILGSVVNGLMPAALVAIIACYAVLTAFAFITLPVEFDATNRALVWLNKTGITGSQEHDKATTALKWAAMTYVVAALGSLATMLYYIMLLMNRD